jgi:hypothetical protein
LFRHGLHPIGSQGDRRLRGLDQEHRIGSETPSRLYPYHRDLDLEHHLQRVESDRHDLDRVCARAGYDPRQR